MTRAQSTSSSGRHVTSSSSSLRVRAPAWPCYCLAALAVPPTPREPPPHGDAADEPLPRLGGVPVPVPVPVCPCAHARRTAALVPGALRTIPRGPVVAGSVGTESPARAALLQRRSWMRIARSSSSRTTLGRTCARGEHLWHLPVFWCLRAWLVGTPVPARCLRVSRQAPARMQKVLAARARASLRARHVRARVLGVCLWVAGWRPPETPAGLPLHVADSRPATARCAACTPTHGPHHQPSLSGVQGVWASGFGASQGDREGRQVMPWARVCVCV